ncbi:Uncharacterised protein [Mycobacterium tuberculosis]|nr:Uncharacterised protein [Mycobacterium tuberculosis]
MKLESSERSKTRLPLAVTAPESVPLLPPLPTCSVAPLPMVVPPL